MIKDQIDDGNIPLANIIRMGEIGILVKLQLLNEIENENEFKTNAVAIAAFLANLVQKEEKEPGKHLPVVGKQYAESILQKIVDLFPDMSRSESVKTVRSFFKKIGLMTPNQLKIAYRVVIIERPNPIRKSYDGIKSNNDDLVKFNIVGEELAITAYYYRHENIQKEIDNAMPNSTVKGLYEKRLKLMKEFKENLQLYNPRERILPKFIFQSFKLVQSLIKEVKDTPPYFSNKYLFTTEETIAPLKIQTSLFYGGKLVAGMKNVVASNTEVYKKELAAFLINKIRAFMEGDDVKGNYSVLLFGRTATGKTTFWKRFVKTFIENEEYLSTILGRDKTALIDRVETIGFYSDANGNPISYTFEVVHNPLEQFHTYKKWNLKKDIKPMRIWKWDTEHKEQWSGNQHMLWYILNNVTIFEKKVTDMRKIGLVKDAMLDDRMEPKRWKVHLSTRGHIVKRIQFYDPKKENRVFNLNFFIPAGSETAKESISNYGDPNVKKVVNAEAIFLNKDNSAMINLFTQGTAIGLSGTLKRFDEVHKLKFKEQLEKGDINFLLFSWPSAPDFGTTHKETNLYRVTAKDILVNYAKALYDNFGPGGKFIKKIEEIISNLLVQ